MNEDIIVITDKSGNYKEREFNPLFVIILDISGTMYGFSDYLQHKVIPKLLLKLNYGKNSQFFQKINKLNLNNFELLQIISNKYKLKKFLNKYKLENEIDEENIKTIFQDIIVLITFSDDSQLYFFNISDFENNFLSGGGTHFVGAANHLKFILNSVSKERSIRLLSFSDGDIYDIKESMLILNSISNSSISRHQINSVSVRVCHNTEPDTKILMKLSTFSHPINDMAQIVLNPEEDDVDYIVSKLYNLFENDGMNYNLKLFSDIIFMSDDFSDNFSKEQSFNRENVVLRVKNHLTIDEYKKHLKVSVGKVHIENGGEIDENNFYNIMGNNAPYIAQRILEKKVNQKNKNENNIIINYFQKTEDGFEKGKKNLSEKDKLYNLFKEINEDKTNFNSPDLSERIIKVRDEAKDIIKERLKDIKFADIINKPNQITTYNFSVISTRNTFYKIEKNNIFSINPLKRNNSEEIKLKKSKKGKKAIKKKTTKSQLIKSKERDYNEKRNNYNKINNKSKSNDKYGYNIKKTLYKTQKLKLKDKKHKYKKQSKSYDLKINNNNNYLDKKYKETSKEKNKKNNLKLKYKGIYRDKSENNINNNFIKQKRTNDIILKNLKQIKTLLEKNISELSKEKNNK